MGTLGADMLFAAGAVGTAIGASTSLGATFPLCWTVTSRDVEPGIGVPVPVEAKLRAIATKEEARKSILEN
jgi:hypothetical protein